MIELLIKGLGIALTAGIIAELLKQVGWRGAPVIASLALVSAVSIFGETFATLCEQILRLSEIGKITRYAEAVLKIIAVGLLSGMVSDTLAELSGNLLSKTALTVGRFEILGISLPFLSEIIDVGLSLISP